MSVILDHLTALVAIGALLLALLAAQREGSRASVSATSQTSGRPHLTGAADWMERDLANLGAGVPEGTAPVVAYAWGADAASLTFLTTPDTSAAAALETVRYERVRVSTRGGTPLYEVRRTRSGSADVVRTPPTVRSFDVVLYDAAGRPLSAGSAAVRSVGVRLVMEPPLGEGSEPMTWARRFYPANLTPDAGS